MKKYKMQTIVGLFFIIGILCIFYMAVKLGYVQIYGEDRTEIKAAFTDASGLRVNSPVNIFGIQAGTVTGLSIDQKRQMAEVKMKIQKGIRIYEDASATIKASGLIGDKYVEIDPGSMGKPLESGGRIIQTAAQPGLSDIIGKFAFGSIGGGQEKTGGN